MKGKMSKKATGFDLYHRGLESKGGIKQSFNLSSSSPLYHIMNVQQYTDDNGKMIVRIVKIAAKYVHDYMKPQG